MTNVIGPDQTTRMRTMYMMIFGVHICINIGFGTGRALIAYSAPLKKYGYEILDCHNH